jgi:PAS domain S-box-containing protein
MSDKPINILLIEDNASDAWLIHEMLSEIKGSLFELECVDRLSAGLERLVAGGIDVVLLGLSLPDSQGFETFVRLHGQNSRAPILVLTGLDDETMAIQAMQAGAQDYLVKGHLANPALPRAIRYAIERQRTEEAQRLLAEASALLAASLDYETTLDRVAHLAVPDLADWCAVHMLEADGMIHRLALAHVDPFKAALVGERADRYPFDPNAQHIVPQVLRTGQPELYPEVPDSLLIASARDAEHLETLRLLGVKSYICVPLMAHGRTFGAITVATSESGRRYDNHDLALAEELARRAATAIDNAQLYRLAQEEIAERQRTEAVLRASQERLAGIVGAAMDAIISVDESQHILVFNTAAEQMFRCPAAAAIGRSLDRFIPARLRRVHAAHIRAFGATGVTSRSMRSPGSPTALRADGEEFPIEATISQIMAAGQKIYTVIIRDITDRKRAEAALQRHADRLKHLHAIEQVLVNLAINARDAMPTGGRLTIETQNVILDHAYAQQYIDVTPGSYLLMVISDTGSGMDAETQERIFEPFFTTKGPERGTGLGLSTCYGIIKQHGGHIWVYSELEHGTTFKIYLPQVDVPAAARTQPDNANELPRGFETVLLAEDDPAVRALAVRVLHDQGYIVLEAVDGATALRLASEYTSKTIDLLLTDVVMPHISGKALFDQINVLHPNIKALFISGYTDDTIVYYGQLDPGVAFLQKPFSSSALVRKVRETLDLG